MKGRPDMSKLTMALKKQGLHALLMSRSNPDAISKHVKWLLRHDARLQHRVSPWSDPEAAASRRQKLRVAAVQMRACAVGSGKAYAELVYRLAARAAWEGASVVVFPEYSGLPLLGLVPGASKVASSAPSLEDASAMARGIGARGAPSDLFALLAPYAQRAYVSTFASVARELGVYMISGSMILSYEAGGVTGLQNMGWCFGPDGSRVARYVKCHLMPMEAQWDLKPGTSLAAFSLGGVGAAAPICMDATYFETFRVARAAGADIVAVPVANPEPYNMWYALRGIWPRVQESQVFGISSCLVGKFAGIEFTGRSAVVCPLEMSPGGDGILAQASSHDDEEIVVADIDLDALHEYRASNPLRFNPKLYSNYPVGLYDRARSARREERQRHASHGTGEDRGGGVRTP
jgi:predicted amidohydrolase